MNENRSEMDALFDEHRNDPLYGGWVKDFERAMKEKHAKYDARIAELEAALRPFAERYANASQSQQYLDRRRQPEYENAARVLNKTEETK